MTNTEIQNGILATRAKLLTVFGQLSAICTTDLEPSEEVLTAIKETAVMAKDNVLKEIANLKLLANSI